MPSNGHRNPGSARPFNGFSALYTTPSTTRPPLLRILIVRVAVHMCISVNQYNLLKYLLGSGVESSREFFCHPQQRTASTLRRLLLCVEIETLELAPNPNPTDHAVLVYIYRTLFESKPFVLYPMSFVCCGIGIETSENIYKMFVESPLFFLFEKCTPGNIVGYSCWKILFEYLFKYFN